MVSLNLRLLRGREHSQGNKYYLMTKSDLRDGTEPVDFFSKVAQSNMTHLLVQLLLAYLSHESSR